MTHAGPAKSRDRRGETAYVEHIDRLPDPSKCEPCKLAKQEVDLGLIALLAKVEADELTPDGDKDVLRSAGELRRLLSARASDKIFEQMKELDRKRPSKGEYVMIPKYIEQKIELSKGLPPLPPILEPSLQEQVFTHASVYESKNKARGIASTDDLSYERLEFIGDAYLEVMATRLIAHRLPHVDVPSQAHFREQLVRNDTLSEFSKGYGLPDRLKHASHVKGVKVWAKITADVFEAYVAAVVLSDPTDGFLTAEKWMNQLWAKQMLEYREPILVENANAQEELNKLVHMNHIKLTYTDEKEMQMTALGVQQFFQGVYLTGWGYENEWLGSGVGRNKAQAAINAAQDALTRNNDALQTARTKKQEFLAQQQIERDQKRADLRRRADEGDEEAVAELRRILSNDIRIKRKQADRGDKDAAAKLKGLLAEEEALTGGIDAKGVEKAASQSESGLQKTVGMDGHTEVQDMTTLKKHKKKQENKQEDPKPTKENEQSNEDFLANILAWGKSAKESQRDCSSWLEKEQKKKEKEERKKQERMTKKERKVNGA